MRVRALPSFRSCHQYIKHEIVTVKVGDWIEGNGRLKTPTMKQLWSGLAPYRTKVNTVEVHYLSC